jgi:hypothetical protein
MGIGSVAEGPLVSYLVGCLLVGYLLVVLLVGVVVAVTSLATVVRKFSHCTVPGPAWTCTRSLLRGTQRSSCTARRLRVH